MTRAVLGLAVVLLSCGAVEAEQAEVATSAEELRVELGPRAIAYDYSRDPANISHGVAGDDRVVFAAQPLRGVAVLDRFTGKELGTLPAPSGGFGFPFSVRVVRPGLLVVLDSGAFPSPTVVAVPRLLEYTYSVGARGAVTASVSRVISFAGLPLVFAEEVEVLPGGAYVVSESIVGALWHVSSAGVITPGVLPASLAPGAGIPALGPCGFSPTSIGGVPFGSPGNLAPGVSTLAVRGSELYFSSTCTGGVWSVPVATLTDATRTPSQRAADIVRVVDRPVGVSQESLKGLSFNRWNALDTALYAADALQRRIIRIDLRTGRRQVLADDPALFDFPVGMQFLPPVAGLTPLVVASDQQYRLAAFNPLIPADLLRPPFVIAKVFVRP